MKTKKIIVLSVLLTIIVSSCDYMGTYYYYIENGLANETVKIITHIPSHLSSTGKADSVFVISPKERKLVYTTTGIAGVVKKRDPITDVLTEYCELGEFETFINNVKLEKPLWERKYWQYTTGELTGTYLLVINERIVNE